LPVPQYRLALAKRNKTNAKCGLTEEGLILASGICRAIGGEAIAVAPIQAPDVVDRRFGLKKAGGLQPKRSTLLGCKFDSSMADESN
jgi:hypothetical protein